MYYQSEMRQIGEWLDERGVHGVQVLEAPDGFAVQCRWENDSRPSILRQFTHAELLALHRASSRWQAPSPRMRRDRCAPSRRSSYRDILRALGHELDQVAAHTLLLDELEDGLLVTYQYQLPQHPTTWHKHMAMLSILEQRTIVTSARARRKMAVGLSSRLNAR